MDIFQLVLQEHRRLQHLIAKVNRASNNCGRRRLQLMKLSRELDAHTAAEEQTLYADLLALSQDHVLAEHSVSEHDKAFRLITELQHAAPKDSWISIFENLQSEVLHHLETEERCVLQRARQLIGKEQALRLGRRYKIIKSYHLSTWGEPPTP